MENNNGQHANTYTDVEINASAKNIPMYAHLELTYRCNLKCVHCYTVPQEADNELTTNEAYSILNQLAELSVLYLSLTGGEALLRNDFFEIAHYARKKDFALRIFTNATLIDENIAKQLADLCPLFVEISLYGISAKTHEAITAVPGSFERTMAAIRILQTHKLNIHIKSPVMTLNIHELEAIRTFARDIGAMFRPDPVIFPKLDSSDIPLNYRINEEGLGWYFREISPEWKPRPLPLDKTVCNAGKGIMAISPYGDVYPCLRIQNNAGNVRTSALTEIWTNSPIMKEIRELTLTNLKRCAICDDIQYCSPCPGIALLEHGDITQPANECCRQARTRRKNFI